MLVLSIENSIFAVEIINKERNMAIVSVLAIIASFSVMYASFFLVYYKRKEYLLSVEFNDDQREFYKLYREAIGENKEFTEYMLDKNKKDAENQAVINNINFANMFPSAELTRKCSQNDIVYHVGSKELKDIQIAIQMANLGIGNPISEGSFVNYKFTGKSKSLNMIVRFLTDKGYKVSIEDKEEKENNSVVATIKIDWSNND